eukprot:1158262-Pelagomonas_calceolata.AAC.4
MSVSEGRKQGMHKVCWWARAPGRNGNCALQQGGLRSRAPLIPGVVGRGKLTPAGPHAGKATKPANNFC